jgi:hypothetical protein
MGRRGQESAHLLGSLPLGELAQALLAGPHGGVDDLQEKLPSARVEDEDGAVDGLRGQVALEGLVDGHAVHVCVVHEPDDLHIGVTAAVSTAYEMTSVCMTTASQQSPGDLRASRQQVKTHRFCASGNDTPRLDRRSELA